MKPVLDIRLAEWESVGPDDSVRGRPLRGVWLEDAAARQVAATLARAGILEIDELRAGLAVRARSFVGRIQLGSLRITIEPKIAREPLLRVFRYAYGLRRLMLVNDSTADVGSLFLDVLLHQLRVEVDELRRRGLLQSYMERKEELSTPRGRIDLGRLAARGGMLSATIPCRHTPRSLDHVLNRAVAAGVALATNLAQDAALRADLLILQRRLDASIQSVRLDRELLRSARRSLSRLSSSYEPPLTILELLLDGMSIELDAGESLRIPGFLFDMNRLFQALVERLLVEYLVDHEVRSEARLVGMIAYVKNPRRRRAPQPRPDLTVRENKPGEVTLLDAKYRLMRSTATSGTNRCRGRCSTNWRSMRSASPLLGRRRSFFRQPLQWLERRPLKSATRSRGIDWRPSFYALSTWRRSPVSSTKAARLQR